MRIREATPDDARAIARVHIDTWRSTYKGIVPDRHLAKLSYKRLGRGWARHLSKPERQEIVWVIEDDQAGGIGFARAGPCRDPDITYDAALHAIYPLPQYQKRGWGTRLLLTVVQALLDQGMRSLVLWVLADNPSRAFYEALGGEQVAEHRREIGGKMLTEVAYAWPSLEALLDGRHSSPRTLGSHVS